VKYPDNEAKPKACHQDTKSQRKAKSFHRKKRQENQKLSTTEYTEKRSPL
jgi:hypothetical protein